jgi:paraquat-inducible protein A
MKAPRPRWFSHSVLLVAAYFFLAGAAGVKIAVHEAQSSRLIERIAAREDLNGVVAVDQYEGAKRLGFVLSSVLRLINPSGSTAAQVAAGQREVVVMTAELQQEFVGSLQASLVLVAFSALFLLGALAPGGDPAEAAERRIYALLSVSVVFFVIGISLPVLTAVVRGEHRIIGGFIIQTASKGIVSTVLTLWRSGNWIIGVLLAGFSIGIPIFKGVAVVIALAQPTGRARATTGRWLEAIGRWSLTDVLVAAILLSCFSLNAFRETDGGVFAAPRFAFGFFVAYCILASVTSNLLKRADKLVGDRRPSVARAAANAALLVVALGAGALTGFFGLANSSYVREAAHSSVLKLVQPHAPPSGAKTKPGK